MLLLVPPIKRLKLPIQLLTKLPTLLAMLLSKPLVLLRQQPTE